MNIRTKLQLSRMTFFLLTLVTLLFLLGIFVLVLCVGLQINPFGQMTSTFLLSVFIGLIGAVAVLVLFNVATSINLIADVKMSESKIETSGGGLKKWIAGFSVAAATLACVVFAGTYISKYKYLAVVHAQADEVLEENKDLLEKVAALLASGKVEDFKKAHEIHDFLERQRSDLPSLMIIYAGEYDGRVAYYAIDSYFHGDAAGAKYTKAYFRCTKGIDCDYLKRFFSGEKVDVMQKFTFRDDQYYVYIPYIGKDTRFVLLFNKRNSFGKSGR